MSPTPADENPGREVLRDLATGLLCLTLTAFLAASHFSQGGRLHEDYGAEPGPALLPELLLAALGLTGLGLVLRGMIERRRLGVTLQSFGTGHPLRLAASAATVALLLAFLLLQAVTGFGPAATVFAAAMAALLARQEGRAPLPAALEGAALAVALYALFRLVLSVPLP